ncbi:MAG: DUF1616 domain-containing protein [Chloroflexi bacterium]|nr:DUF1616 domain-containing protein [Chloroflexota bacterium]
MTRLIRSALSILDPAAHYGFHRLMVLGSLALLPMIGLAEWVPLLAPLRLILGLAFALYVPGYCLMLALFPSPDDLDGIERAGLSVGLSIALIPPLALVLNVLPWGIRLWPIVIAEYGAAALFAGAALWRRSRLPAQARDASGFGWHPEALWLARVAAERRVYALLAALLLLAGVITLWVMAVPSPDRYMTEFYVLGKDGRAEDYPQTAALSDELTLTIGIVNREQGERTYRVETWVVDGWDPDRRMLVGQTGPLSLRPGSGDQQHLTWRMPWAGNDQKVEFWLFVGDSGEPYRKLRLWIDVLPPGKSV